MSTIIDFYRNIKQDHAGRFLFEIHDKFNHEKLENTHDYIQWLFPLKEQSGYSIHAPLLTNEDILIMMEDNLIKKNIIKSFNLLLDFYGYTIIETNGVKQIVEAKHNAKSIKNWINKDDHNYLRITRILKFLNYVELNEYMILFIEKLTEIYVNNKKSIGETTYRFWRAAGSIERHEETSDYYKVWNNNDLIVHYPKNKIGWNGRQIVKDLFETKYRICADYYQINGLMDGEDLRGNNE